MSAANHTKNYNLSQFQPTDRPTWLGDYNGDMSKIDARMKANADAIEQAAAGGLKSVSHTVDLTGDGTSKSPLGIAATIARKTDIPDTSGLATTESVTRAIAAAIADRLTAGDIKAGNDINIETSGNTVTISYVGGGLSAVVHDGTLTGSGTGGSPLGAAMGSALNQGVTEQLKKLNFDAYTSSGIYGIALNTGDCENAPSAMGNGVPVRAVLLVSRCGFSSSNGTTLQVLFTGNSTREDLAIYMRGLRSGTWDEWRRMASTSDIPDVSGLTSRIATLESQVAALVNAAPPATTGLTAAQLDTQYLGGYDIVRVGTSTYSSESEESSR